MTSFDGLVIAVLILSTGFAVIRGALREIGTLAALGVAAVAAYLLVGPLLAASGISPSFLTTIVVAGAVLSIGFAVAYFALHIGLRRVRLEGRALVIDRIGGGVFGFARGLALVGLGFLAYSYYLDEARRPEAVNNALTLPVAKSMAAIFDRFAPQTENGDESDGTVDTQAANAALEGYARTDRTALAEIVTTMTTSDETDNEADVAHPPADPIAELLTESESE
jgi:membrane protein required for colicin V production